MKHSHKYIATIRDDFLCITVVYVDIVESFY